jgi:hypothetical protein
MGYAKSHKFCLCIPVRFGVFIMASLGALGGSIIAIVGWLSVTHKGVWPFGSACPSPENSFFPDQAHLTGNQDISLALASLSYTVFAIVSIFGSVFFPQDKSRAQTHLCAQADWCHHQTTRFPHPVWHGPNVSPRVQHHFRCILHLYAFPHGRRARRQQLRQ